MSEWKPISTAPRDGTPVLIAPHMMVANFDFGDDEWVVAVIPLQADRTIADVWTKPSAMMFMVYAQQYGMSPTHWAPLPELPQ